MKKLVENLKDELLESLQSYKNTVESYSPGQKEKQAYLKGKIDTLNCIIMMLKLEADREQKEKN